MLSLRRVSRSFGKARALLSLSLDGSPGEVVPLVGPNGAGRTTTLRPIAGLIRRDERADHILTPARDYGTIYGGASARVIRL